MRVPRDSELRHSQVPPRVHTHTKLRLRGLPSPLPFRTTARRARLRVHGMRRRIVEGCGQPQLLALRRGRVPERDAGHAVRRVPGRKIPERDGGHGVRRLSARHLPRGRRRGAGRGLPAVPRLCSVPTGQRGERRLHLRRWLHRRARRNVPRLRVRQVQGSRRMTTPPSTHTGPARTHTRTHAYAHQPARPQPHAHTNTRAPHTCTRLHIHTFTNIHEHLPRDNIVIKRPKRKIDHSLPGHVYTAIRIYGAMSCTTAPPDNLLHVDAHKRGQRRGANAHERRHAGGATGLAERAGGARSVPLGAQLALRAAAGGRHKAARTRHTHGRAGARGKAPGGARQAQRAGRGGGVARAAGGARRARAGRGRGVLEAGRTRARGDANAAGGCAGARAGRARRAVAVPGPVFV